MNVVTHARAARASLPHSSSVAVYMSRIAQTVCGASLLALSTAMAQVPAPHQTGPAPDFWVIHASTEMVGMGQGLPVFALQRDDWPRYRTGSGAVARAFQSSRFTLSATHTSGWKIGTLLRTEASLEASRDTVDLATFNANGADPPTPRDFGIHAIGQGWQAAGIVVGTPWLALDAQKRWQGQVQLQLMTLRQLRTDAVSGFANYQGGGSYDFALQSQRSRDDLAAPFLQPSDSAGRAASVSFALKARPTDNWKLQLRAEDLLSLLDWPSLGTESATLNTRVLGRASDGTLNYAPLIVGRNTLERGQGRIGARWVADLVWSPRIWRESGGASFRAERKLGLAQYWLGWDQAAQQAGGLTWRLEIEPTIRAASFTASWRNWEGALATDGQRAGSELSQLRLAWRSRF